MSVTLARTRSAAEAPRGTRRGNAGPRAWVPYLYLIPGVALFAVAFAWPASIAVQLAFYRYNVVKPPVFIGLDNFSRMLADDAFYRALTNSLTFLALYIPWVVVVPLALALLVNIRLPGIQAYRMMYYLPVVTSMVAVAIAWRYLLSEQGVVNWLLSLVGLPPTSFLLNTSLALPTVVLIEAWKNTGLYMMIYLAGLQAIPSDLIEAAKMDGAGALRRAWYVVVPGMRPVFAVTLTLGMLDAMRAFESVFVLTKGGPQDATVTLGYFIWSTAFQRHEMGYASAVGLFLWAIMIVLALLNLFATRNRD